MSNLFDLLCTVAIVAILAFPHTVFGPSQVSENILALRQFSAAMQTAEGLAKIGDFTGGTGYGTSGATVIVTNGTDASIYQGRPVTQNPQLAKMTHFSGPVYLSNGGTKYKTFALFINPDGTIIPSTTWSYGMLLATPPAQCTSMTIISGDNRVAIPATLDCNDGQTNLLPGATPEPTP